MIANYKTKLCIDGIIKWEWKLVENLDIDPIAKKVFKKINPE